MKFALKILPKPEVLDTQGRAVQSAMQSQGHQLQACQVGKYLVLDIDAPSSKEGEAMARNMAEKSGLCNLLIENYEVEPL